MTQPYAALGTRVGRIEGGKYRLVRLLGAGGMGDVYEAQHSVVGRRFAIKFLHPNLAGNIEMVARFQREAQAAGSLENENVAAVVDAGTADDGAPYLVMEYLEGEVLAQLLLRTGPLSVPRATYIIIQACRGLAAAHERNIVHRDLKPENLFICKRGDGTDLVKVLDFGIAKLHAGAPGTGLTRTGATMGTPFYMSLEQARGAKEVDHRTDVYALGVILYEILTGAKPHPGDSYNEILYHVISNEPTPLESFRGGLPAGLPAVVNKAMAREASDRHTSVAAFAEALVPFAGQVVAPMRSRVGMPSSPADTLPTPGSLPGIVVPRTVLPHKPETGTGQVPHSHSRLFFLSVVVVAAVVLLTAATVLLPFGRQQKSRASFAAPATLSARPPPGTSPSPTVSPPVTERSDSLPMPSPEIVEVEDGPPGLQVTVDGKPEQLPLPLPYGPEIHTLLFRAPGYSPREVRIDGLRQRRSLMLTMKKLNAAPLEAIRQKAPASSHRRGAISSAPTTPTPPVSAAPVQAAKPPLQNKALILDF